MSNAASPKFEPGILLTTPGAQAAVPPEELLTCLCRHLTGDWGEVCPADAEENEFSLRDGFRLLSAYTSSNGTRFWIITEADRSATTILLPEEY